MTSFNLLDKLWIPCVERAGGVSRQLSLREVFAEAPRLAGIADPSPAVTLALHRLLLAILHRSLDGPRNAREWGAIWERDSWDLDRIYRYLDQWYQHFDLFDAEHPFCQTPGLEAGIAERSASRLAPQLPSDGNRSLLFDHTFADASLDPAEAARYMLAQHLFAVGGLISLLQGEPLANKFTASAPLLGRVTVLMRGETLFRTLMLNWVQYNREAEQPFPFKKDSDDKPAWERAGAQPEPRQPDGYVDLLTWQSRRILLLPEVTANGAIRVHGAALMKGYQFAEGFEQWSTETMLGFRKNPDPKMSPPWFAISLDPDRLVWRDSQTLLQAADDTGRRPKTLGWLDNLMGEGILEERLKVPLEVYGVIPDQANISDWRRESLPLPLRLLRQGDAVTKKLLERLGEALALAEDAGHLFDATWVGLGKGRLRSPMWELCEALLKGVSEREPKREDCITLAQSFGAGTRYWSRLDAQFRAFIEQLADPDDVAVVDGARVYGTRAVRAWAEDVRRAARAVFEGIVADLDTSARSLLAGTRGHQRFDVLVARLMAPYREATKDGEVTA
jgi:CRISPR system Cascade subunit CasA